MSIKKLFSGKTEKNENTREKILEAAISSFAEKGFDGARVDEIAKRAGVNKAMLYYYFHSKEQLFKELLKNTLDDAMDIVRVSFENKKSFEYEDMNRLLDGIIDSFQKKKEILRIIIIEGLKLGTTNNILFEMVGPVYELIIDKIGHFRDIKEQKNDLHIRIFFTCTLPLIFYFTLGDRWAEYNKVKPEDLKDKFFSFYRDMTYRYILS